MRKLQRYRHLLASFQRAVMTFSISSHRVTRRQTEMGPFFFFQRMCSMDQPTSITGMDNLFRFCSENCAFINSATTRGQTRLAMVSETRADPSTAKSPADIEQAGEISPAATSRRPSALQRNRIGSPQSDYFTPLYPSDTR